MIDMLTKKIGPKPAVEISNTSVSIKPADRRTIIAMSRAVERNAEAIIAIANTIKSEGNQYGIYIDNSGGQNDLRSNGT
jgi:hypothetical protein